MPNEIKMSENDAAKVLGLDGDLNKENIKKAYRTACSKYHPDKGGSNEMMSLVNVAYEVLKDFEGTIKNDQVDYGASINEALNKIINLQGIIIEVCGSWVWVSGDTKQYSHLLGKKEGGAGFTYARKKKMWNFRPEGWKSKSRGQWTMDEIRDGYGSRLVDTVKSEKISYAA